ncbi:hypothetical protein BDA99DRAFT_565476 [Phascolomyces articulosus]|uniref:Major facilitator superfamily (MFS) profile domain-containing protein n=1 Tax=Phascolomyces articulosus TaxID=60185 RepID=A0AAD5JZ45_9FUNG|nr:hypothetical protein BDA99DRAFT_565476 [Phascolomyces articulosus]
MSFNMALVLGGTTCLNYDLLPNESASVAASINIVGSTLGVAGTGLMGPVLNALCPGWTYILLGGILSITNVMLIVLLKYSIKWRTQRVQKNNQANTGQ